MPLQCQITLCLAVIHSYNIIWVAQHLSKLFLNEFIDLVFVIDSGRINNVSAILSRNLFLRLDLLFSKFGIKDVFSFQHVFHIWQRMIIQFNMICSNNIQQALQFKFSMS